MNQRAGQRNAVFFTVSRRATGQSLRRGFQTSAGQRLRMSASRHLAFSQDRRCLSPISTAAYGVTGTSCDLSSGLCQRR